MPPDPPWSVSVNKKSYSYAPDSSCDIRISRAQLIKAEISENCYALLSTLACEHDLTDTIHLDEIANPWANLTKRGHLINKSITFHSKLYVFLQYS
jgi:hypothetical protein